MALLTGDLQGQIFAAFKGKLLKGLIRQIVIGVSGGLDARGDPIDVAPVYTRIEGFVEDYSDYFKATAGVPQTDVKVNIFGGSCPGVTPGKDDIVMLKGIAGQKWYQLRGPISTDPATALWVCQAQPTKAPDDAP